MNILWSKDPYTGDHVVDLGMLYIRVATAPRMMNGELKNIVLTQENAWVVFWRSGHVHGRGVDVDDAKRSALDAAKTLVDELSHKLCE